MVGGHHIITMQLTWRTIKANPIRAIREIRAIEQSETRAWKYGYECEAKFLKVRDQLHDQADLLGQITRLQSEVYDLKKRQGLPR